MKTSTKIEKSWAGKAVDKAKAAVPAPKKAVPAVKAKPAIKAQERIIISAEDVKQYNKEMMAELNRAEAERLAAAVAKPAAKPAVLKEGAIVLVKVAGEGIKLAQHRRGSFYSNHGGSWSGVIGKVLDWRPVPDF